MDGIHRVSTVDLLVKRARFRLAHATQDNISEKEVTQLAV